MLQNEKCHTSLSPLCFVCLNFDDCGAAGAAVETWEDDCGSSFVRLGCSLACQWKGKNCSKATDRHLKCAKHQPKTFTAMNTKQHASKAASGLRSAPAAWSVRTGETSQAAGALRGECIRRLSNRNSRLSNRNFSGCSTIVCELNSNDCALLPVHG